jgi:type IV pilus assembly protein PilN
MARINLLPWRENLRQQRQQNFMISLVVVILLAVGIVLLGNQVMKSMISGQENRNTYLRGEIRKLENDIRRIEQLEVVRDNLIARKNVIERLQINRSLMVHLFNQMAETVPDGVTLNAVRQSGPQLTFSGTSESESRVSEYMRSIEDAEWLHNPRLRIVQRAERADRPGQPYQFELSARIAAPDSDQQEN